MADLEILGSKRLGIATTLFTVRAPAGVLEPGLFISGDDTIGPFEYRIVTIRARDDGSFDLYCFNWVLRDGYLTGRSAAIHRKNKRDTERYDRAMEKEGVAFGDWPTV